MLVNNFVTSSVEFLNKFSSLCEQKLLRVSQQVQRVEIVLSLLEAKLDSIGWMAGGAAQAPAGGDAQPAIAASSAPVAPPMDGSVPPAPGPPGAPAAPAAAAPAAPAVAHVCVKDDPRFSKYFKMLNMGVPAAAVKIKMSNEGADPSVIDLDPEAPAPPGGEAAASTSQALVLADGGGSDSEKSDAMSDDDE